MKQTTLISIATLMTASLLLSGCGKSAQEEYSDLCKKYEPYAAAPLVVGKFYTAETKVFYKTEKNHAIMDKHKEHILEGEKIFVQMEKLAKDNPEIMKHFQVNYLAWNQTPKAGKERFNRILKEHKKYHQGCTYNFQF